MTQLSMNLNGVGSRAPATDHEFELLPDLLEELEQTPRETVLAVLRLKYGPSVEVRLNLKKGAGSEGFNYTTRCPFHNNANKPVAVLALDRYTRIYCPKCNRTGGIEQMLEENGIEQRQLLEFVHSNLEELQQEFQRLSEEDEAQIARERGYVTLGQQSPHFEGQPRHMNPALPSSPKPRTKQKLSPETIPPVWNLPTYLEPVFLNSLKAVSGAVNWDSPTPSLQPPKEQSLTEHTGQPQPGSKKFKKPSNMKKQNDQSITNKKTSSESLEGLETSSSEETLVLCHTSADRKALLASERFLPVVVSMGNTPVEQAMKEVLCLPQSGLLLAFGQTDQGIGHYQQVCRILSENHYTKSIGRLTLPTNKNPSDCDTPTLSKCSFHQVNLYQNKTSEEKEKKPKILKMRELIEMDLPPERPLLKPWLPEDGIVLLHAKAGAGKTYFAMAVAYAVATGGTFLGWEAPEPAGVLYCDAELPIKVLQERLKQLSKVNSDRCPENFHLLNNDFQELGIPSIDTVEGFNFIEEALQPGIRLLVLDNLSTLLRNGVENEAQSWQPTQDWILSLRRKGITTMVVHHSGKSGDQRGTSKRLDVANTVLSLSLIDNGDESKTMMTLNFSKHRGFFGAEAAARRITLQNGIWNWTPESQNTRNVVKQLIKEGMKQSEISRELGISRQAVSEHAKKIKAEDIDVGENEFHIDPEK